MTSFLRKIFYVLVIVFCLQSMYSQKVEAQSCGGGTVTGGNRAYTCVDSKNISCACGTAGCSTRVYKSCAQSQQIAEFCNEQGYCSACVSIVSWGECGNGNRCNWGGATSCPSSCSGGSNCFGQSVSGSPIGTYVCGGGQINYRCLSNGAWSSQSTSCTQCSTPTAVTSSCSYPSNSSTVAWNADAGAEYYALRINDSTVSGWDGTCSSANANQGNFCANITSPTTSYNWTGIAGHSYTWWVHACDNQTGCSAATAFTYLVCVTATPTPTPTATPTPTPTPTPVLLPYYKMKDTSFYKVGAISSNFPPSYSCPASQYDSSDTCTGGYFNQDQAGVVISSTSSISGGSGGTALSGASTDIRNWTGTISSGINAFAPSSFLNYIRAKKNTTAAANVGAMTTSGSTYSLPDNTSVTISSTPSFADYITVIVDGDLTLSVNDIVKNGATFIVDGNVAVNGESGTFNGSNRPFAVISTGTITFANALTEADGLFVGNVVDFGLGTNPLKIVGNISSVTASSFSRDRVSSKASMFIVFDPRHYMNIVDKISTVKSSWTQLQ